MTALEPRMLLLSSLVDGPVVPVDCPVDCPVVGAVAWPFVGSVV
jgi:hypothetical protein